MTRDLACSRPAEDVNSVLGESVVARSGGVTVDAMLYARFTRNRTGSSHISFVFGVEFGNRSALTLDLI